MYKQETNYQKQMNVQQELHSSVVLDHEQNFCKYIKHIIFTITYSGAQHNPAPQKVSQFIYAPLSAIHNHTKQKNSV